MSVRTGFRLATAFAALSCGVAQAGDDCIGLKGTDGAITRCMPVASGKSDRPVTSVTGSLPAGKTDRGGAQVLATGLIGSTVYTSDGREAGKLVDMVMASSFDGVSLIIRTGGILGLNGREIAVPAGKAILAKSDAGRIRLTLAVTPEQLQSAPVFDRTALMR